MYNTRPDNYRLLYTPVNESAKTDLYFHTDTNGQQLRADDIMQDKAALIW